MKIRMTRSNSYYFALYTPYAGGPFAARKLYK
jgi:hypothetical protein